MAQTQARTLDNLLEPIESIALDSMVPSPKLSIITPVFNGERYIEACLNNVIAQACPDTEHIIVDGDSRDGTVSIIERYAKAYSHIKWISEPDKGQSDAINKGLKIAAGEIIGILNADDYYEPNVLNEVMNQFEKFPNPSFLVGMCNVWGDGDTLLYVNKALKLNLLNILSGRSFPVNPSAYFYHKSIHSRIGYYDVGDHYAMDLDFLLRVVQVVEIKYIKKILGNFRLIKGCKTFESMDGDGKLYFDARERVMQKYLKNLTPVQKIAMNCLKLRELYFKKPWIEIRYLLRRIRHYKSSPGDMRKFLSWEYWNK